MVYTCDPSIQKGRQEDPKFEDSLRYSSDILSQLKKITRQKESRISIFNLSAILKYLRKENSLAKLIKSL